MMKAIIILFLSVSFTLTCKAQAYKPFPTSGAVWREYQTGYQCDCCSEYQISITGDTIINAMTYHKLVKTGIMYEQTVFGDCTNLFWYNINHYLGSFRNDSLNKRVYFYPAFGISEYLLYDFNLNIGDTTETYLSFGMEPTIVTAIDSVLISNVYHRRLKLNDCISPPLYIIEGMGSTFGLLSLWICWEPIFEHISELVCFKQNDQTVYPNMSFNCELISSDNSINENTKNLQVFVFPNPAHDLITIKTSLIAFEIHLLNESGQIVLHKKAVTNESQLDISDLPIGQYTLEILEKGKRLHTQAIIRQ